MSALASLVEATRGVLPPSLESAALHEPCFAGNEWRYLKDCLDSGWVSSAGAYVDRFEAALCETTGCGHAVATCNGTAALHLGYLLAGVEPGCEVIAPALTFVATINALAYCGALPHFADCSAETLALDPGRLAAHLEQVAERRPEGLFNKRSGRRIAAVVCTHVFGHPAALDDLVALCRHWELPLIEDAAEGLGSFYRGRHVGCFGTLAALSFNGNKILTTGGGGALVTGDPALADKARHLSTTSKLSHAWRYDHDAVAYNYRMPNLNAALGCAQLEQLERFLAAKRSLAERYQEAVAPLESVRFLAEPPDSRSNYWLCTILLEPGCPFGRDALLAALHEAGLYARPAWTPMHRLPMFAEAPRMDLSVTEDLVSRLICLPSSVALA